MPAYKAEATLKKTYDEVMSSGVVDQVILVDDASPDGTVALARTLPQTTVIVHQQNRGYGGNQKTCYRAALEAGADIVVMVHPDYQYTPLLIPAMASMISSGILLAEITVLIAAWRWQQLLSVFQIEASVRSLLCIAQIGQFFMIFLPGPTGDDLTRMLYISRLAKGRVVEACTSVAIDRLIGLGSILILAVICIPSQWELLATTVSTHWMALGIVTFGGITVMAGIFFFLVGHPTRLWFQHQLRAFPARGLRDEIARIWGLLCDSKPAVARVITAAVGTQILVCTMFYLAGMAVGLHIPMFSWMGVVPIILAASAVPITIAGIGVREYLLVLFLGVLANINGEKALAASLITFSMMLAVCLAGGIVYIFYRPAKDDELPIKTL